MVNSNLATLVIFLVIPLTLGLIYTYYLISELAKEAKTRALMQAHHQSNKRLKKQQEREANGRRDLH